MTNKNGLDYYAMKALKKDVVLQSDEVESTMLERDVCKLGSKNPFLTKLYCSFQNEVIILRYILNNFRWFKLNIISYLGIFVFSYGISEWRRLDVSYFGVEILGGTRQILRGRDPLRTWIPAQWRHYLSVKRNLKQNFPFRVDLIILCIFFKRSQIGQHFVGFGGSLQNCWLWHV